MWWLGILLVLATLLSLAARFWWPLELLTHFTVHYLWLLAPLTIWLLFRRRFAVAALVGACLVWNLVLVAPSFFGGTECNQSVPRVKLVVANVLTRNSHHGEFLRFLERENPDLILAMEIDDRWATALSELNEEYPHRKSVPRDDNFGIALLSKLPLHEVEVREFGSAGVPSIQVGFTIDGRAVTLIGTHPLPPIRHGSRLRNEQLTALGRTAVEIDGPLIVAGDLNVTPWSPYFADLVSETRLHDSRRGCGVQPSWPSQFGPLGIPIDHVLVSEDIGVCSRRIGEHVGSDHRPVIVELALALP